MVDDGDCGVTGDEDWHEKPKYSEKSYPCATLSTTNPTWPNLGSNLGRRGGKPATNHLSYGATSREVNKRRNKINKWRPVTSGLKRNVVRRKISPPYSGNVNRAQFAACFWELPAWSTDQRWIWRRYLAPKRWAFSEIQGVTNQNTVLFTVTAARVSSATEQLKEGTGHYMSKYRIACPSIRGSCAEIYFRTWK
jgi:hypothetical protein